MPNVTRLCELGMPTVVARDVVNQFTAVTPPNAGRYIEHGISPVLANELAAQATGTKNVNRLIEAGMVEDLAREVVS